MCRWNVTLPPTDAVTPFVITATSDLGTISLSDVLFGDVWVCSGQSNMQFTVPQVSLSSLPHTAICTLTPLPPHHNIFRCSMQARKRL